MQQSIIEQNALERVAESMKRSQFTEYPDQLGKRAIGTACCKEIPGEQSLPQLVLLSDSDLTMKQLQLKTLSHSIKHDLIDKDFSAFLKEWKDILSKHWEHYMMQLEILAKNNNLAIYKCKIIWCEKSLLRGSFKSDNQKQKRRMVEKNNTQQDANNSLSSSNNMFETDGGESPIMVSSTEMSVEPAQKRSRR
ncbi:hypothetical protein PHYBLDRAFT_145520 [Phycomyces blakesleeanus NRRL 1555(-)]|uniref:Uncharacterized protein n=1 Tax=Phycomyces blakesleeanus (strain ATCC 8743b / DSM 1359 / FGSC 10004 / NBRC 33097 / NRRL 1555) TaxID=763407 RepID=A0A162PLS2_PHYB8|nr:hypothetical protein PHYBLDRAFT_145520 [Phycomyces blakesleeanus NRRL 1555(-)]OAD74057.1 hypothetical protein PHYBLDRAFT_145520 [Phycomyces blakesleeanus NRRL 1555(-)]|eukprot:XP_018292097.1 hypothetical protein PHYBLDRAFT_145520 [Phycomyces blakesleeanus NRRL 1555(-)]